MEIFKNHDAVVSPMRKKLAGFINAFLEPLNDMYQATKRGVLTVKRKLPAVYNEIESVIKSQFISFNVSKEIRKRPGFEALGEVIATEMANKLPNLGERKIKQLLQDKESNTFLETLTRGLGGVEEREFTKLRKERLFKRILIANRGEIAVRIIRACRELGVESLQVYTKQDAKSLAVKFADKSIKLGDEAADYLDMEKIIKVAKKYDVDAIHPGYGFLAENAEFSRLCKKNKIKFIGPSYEAILAMGDKINAKNLLKDSGVPILEGTDKPIVNFDEGKAVAEQIGFPVIIKAAAGGGGKGMRIVRKKEEFEPFFNACQTEALSAFKSKDVFIEKYVEDPKHIEFQILADRHNHTIHLGERDCSIQRRHQKLIEEAPSPAVSEEMREKMGQAALKAVSAVKYEGAGTVEFLLDKEGKFYFIEMNTRIQVEHGITELTTGIDLVKEQIKIAAGAKLTLKQEDISIQGWAIECRINAECPMEGFCPVTGTVVNYLPPGGPGIRVCSSCHSGQEVSPHYDSLLAKLMCWGKTRQEAVDRMKRALNEFMIDGVDTTIPFHKTVLSSKAFLKADITTSFIEKNRIMEKVIKDHKKRRSLSKEERAIIISTAVGEYVRKRARFNDKNSAWTQTARQEAVFNE